MKTDRVIWLFCFLSPLLYGLAAILLFGQDANWDLRNYHYYNAFAFLEGGRPGDLLAANRANFYNPLVDIPFYLADQYLPARLTGFLLGLVQGLNLPLLFLLAHRLLSGFRPWPRVLWAMALGLAGMAGGGVLGEIGAVFYDNVVSLGFLGALLIVVAKQDDLIAGPLPKAMGLTALAGLFVGFAFGLKQPWVGYCVGVCFALLLLGGDFKRRFLLSFACGLGVLAGFAVFGGFWAKHLWSLTGNPLFPYFNNLFHAPWAPDNEFRDTTFLPKDALDVLLRPFQIFLNPLVGGEAHFRAPAFPIAYALLLPAGLIAFWKRQAHAPTAAPLCDRQGGLYLIAVALLTYAVWVNLFAIYRYAIGLEMLSPLLILLLLDRMGGGHAWKLIVASLCLTGSMLYGKPAYWVRAEAWENRYVQVEAPPIEAPELTAVFFASGEPTSYLIPFFPKDIRWLRLDGGFPAPTPPDQPFNKERHEIIEKLDRERLFVLLLPKDLEFVRGILALYGLDYLPPPCLTVTSNLMPAPYALCPVARAKGQEH